MGRHVLPAQATSSTDATLGPPKSMLRPTEQRRNQGRRAAASPQGAARPQSRRPPPGTARPSAGWTRGASRTFRVEGERQAVGVLAKSTQRHVCFGLKVGDTNCTPQHPMHASVQLIGVCMHRGQQQRSPRALVRVNQDFICVLDLLEPLLSQLQVVLVLVWHAQEDRPWRVGWVGSCQPPRRSGCSSCLVKQEGGSIAAAAHCKMAQAKRRLLE